MNMREPIIDYMNGAQEPEKSNYVVAKLANIPDIHCVLRLDISDLTFARSVVSQRFLR